MGPEEWRLQCVGVTWRVLKQHVCFKFFGEGFSQWEESGPELQDSSLTSTFHIMKSCRGGGGGSSWVLRAPALGEPDQDQWTPWRRIPAAPTHAGRK